MGTVGDILAAIRIDFSRLLSGWRGLVFTRRPTAHVTDTDKWRLDAPWKRAVFIVWSLLGMAVLSVLYPFVAVGFWLRYVVRQIDRALASLGIIVIVAGVAVVWTGLTAVAWARLSMSGFQAVFAASVVATVSVALSWVFKRTQSRLLTLLVSYPFAVSAAFLPPVTAALYSPTLGSFVLPGSASLAVWLLDNPLRFLGVGAFLREQFDLTGLAFLWMWFAFSIPTGWVLGALVTIANGIRPGDRSAHRDR